ncbi:MAG: Xaa-Pro peptidase family protein [Synergistaceae bacterium]|nr:Xaa-Pro peptidase family protein [Synergistaceae bacterium]
MKGNYAARLNHVCSFLGADGKLARHGKGQTDAFVLICQDGAGWEEIYYLTGFGGTSGVLLLSKEGGILFVDPRYIDAARESSCCEVISCKDARYLSPLQAAVNVLCAMHPRRVAFGGRHIRHVAYRSLRAFLGASGCDAELIDLSGLVSNLRRQKSAIEAEEISKAAGIAAGAYMSAISEACAGMREIDFAALLEYKMKTGGADFMDPIQLMVSSGEMTARPHALPAKRRFAAGDLVMVDFCARSSGYVCDITRMFSVGEPSCEVRSLYSILRWAQAEGASLLAPGVRARDVDAAVMGVMNGAGLGGFCAHGAGHGIGLCVHEPPSLNATSLDVLAEGDVIALEPAFYKTNWLGMRLEDDYLITPGGSRKLTGILSDDLFVV